MAIVIEQSVLQGSQWIIFERNAEPLWASIRNAVDAFMY